MTLKQLKKKLKALQPIPLLMLCITPDGEERSMEVQEMIDTGSRFVKVIRGKNLDDLDKMLAYEFATIQAYGE